MANNKLVIVEDLSIEYIVSKLKEQWYPHHKGGCHILTKHNTCLCHLCLIDELNNRTVVDK